MHVAVVANGELPEDGHSALTDLLRSADQVIAADGGLTHCVSLDRWPDRLIGDLDSAPDELIAGARSRGTTVRAYSANKDATDLELALEDAIAIGATAVTVVAPFGGRLDHELATINLLADPRWSSLVMAGTDGRRDLWVVRNELELALDPGATLTLLAWGGPALGVTTAGLQWPLVGETLTVGSTRGVSNVALAEGQRVVLDSGTLLAIHDRYQE